MCQDSKGGSHFLFGRAVHGDRRRLHESFGSSSAIESRTLAQTNQNISDGKLERNKVLRQSACVVACGNDGIPTCSDGNPMNGMFDQRVNFLCPCLGVESTWKEYVGKTGPDDDPRIQPVVLGDSLGASTFLVGSSVFSTELHLKTTTTQHQEIYERRSWILSTELIASLGTYFDHKTSR